MRKIGIAAIAAGLALAATFASAAPRTEMKDSFLPENNLRIPIRATQEGGLTEAQFNQVIDKVEGIFSPIIASMGGKLVIERRWTDDTVNAYAQRMGDVYHVSMFGGLARHPAVTQDGFALVICHELGHHLGGAPRSSSWASNEGEADYYGNLKCLRRVFSSPSATSFTRAAANDEVAQKACAKSYSKPADRALCLRTSMAGVSLGTLLNVLGGGTGAPQFDTPDNSVVDQTDDAHPAAQCRLDTYFQAALCARPWTETMDGADPKVGACTRSQGFTVGMRPLCWYKPGADELTAPAMTADVTRTVPVPATFAALRSREGDAFTGL
ncbi:MAG: hypothetical protein KGJ84_13105 [Elusimicrobia bacterium]|nr:hypothetical protein [Elusimicrobiota bacterium]